MDDELLKRMKADRGWLATQMAKVPIFRGYLEHTTIWEADKLVREEVARRLDNVKRPVEDAIRTLGEDVRAGERIADLNRLLNRLDESANRVRFADYGHSGISGKVKIRDEDLAQLLADDRGLFERLDEIEAAANVLAEMGPEKLESGLTSFEGHFDARKECLRTIDAG